ncbi:Uncharacterized protein APZ42_011781 [Daphnia magna]|uniref:Uncharacterized protein n=1 Tax=Daphnia magna TaxID=35525 RepID=A0A162T017_9CRUS|nr:Uncharacterized protein APZ42_011781 [Daphnia magna]
MRSFSLQYLFRLPKTPELFFTFRSLRRNGMTPRMASRLFLGDIRKSPKELD